MGSSRASEFLPPSKRSCLAYIGEAFLEKDWSAHWGSIDCKHTNATTPRFFHSNPQQRRVETALAELGHDGASVQLRKIGALRELHPTTSGNLLSRVGAKNRCTIQGGNER